MSDEKDNNEGIGSDWNWDSIKDVWGRVSSLHDQLKTNGKDIDSVCKGTLFANMQLFLIQYAGDISTARLSVLDLLYLTWHYVGDTVLTLMKTLEQSGRVGGQHLTDREKEQLSVNSKILEASLETEKTNIITEDEIESFLKAQDHIANAVHEGAQKYGAMAITRALIVMLEQQHLFEYQGDILRARSSLEDQMSRLWPVSCTTAQKLVDAVRDKMEAGSPENKPN